MITTENHGEALVVKVHEQRLDASIAPTLKVTLWDLVSQHEEQSLVLDLSEAEFMDSSGLGVMISLLKLLGAEGGLKLVGLQGTVAQTFKLTRMDRVFAIYDNLDAALA